MTHFVTMNDGKSSILRGNDTFTLAFSNWEESTPNTLANRVSPGSLLRLALAGESKAREALIILLARNWDPGHRAGELAREAVLKCDW